MLRPTYFDHAALSFDAPVQRLSNYLSSSIPSDHSIAVFVGAMAHGKDSFADGIVDEKISISEYSLSASVACGKVSWANANDVLMKEGLTCIFPCAHSSAARLRTFGASSSLPSDTILMVKSLISAVRNMQ